MAELVANATRDRRILAGVALVPIFGFAVACASFGDIARHIRGFQATYLIAFAGYAIIVWLVMQPRESASLGRWGWWLAACLMLRIILLPVAPSDDVYRYVWEGRLQAQGYNPFAHAPDSPELAHLRDEDWPLINHPNYRTIYPPLTQMEFFLVTLAWPSVYGVKVAHVILDLLVVVLLARWSVRAGAAPHRALIYGLCPLTLTAFGIGGHVDTLMLACLAGTALMITRGRFYGAAVLLAGAIAAKLVAVLLLPWLLVRNWKAAILCVACVAIAYLPYASAGWGSTGSLVRFARGTVFFGLAHPVLSVLMDQEAAVLLGLIAVGLTAAWLARQRADFARTGRVAFGLLIVVSPSVHIWYLTWVLLFASIRLRWSWLVLAAGMVWYFEAPHARFVSGVWSLPDWAWYATYGPFAAACVLETLLGSIRRLRSPADRNH